MPVRYVLVKVLVIDRAEDPIGASLADRDGFYEFSDDKLFFGKWCQCNPWNCIPTDPVNGSYG